MPGVWTIHVDGELVGRMDRERAAYSGCDRRRAPWEYHLYIASSGAKIVNGPAIPAWDRYDHRSTIEGAPSLKVAWADAVGIIAEVVGITR